MMQPTAKETTHTKWDAYLPVRQTFLSHSRTRDDIEAAIGDLLEESGQLTYEFDGTPVPMHFDVAAPPDFFPSYSEVPLDRYLRPHFTMLRVSSEGEHTVHHLYDAATGQVSDSATLEERTHLAKTAGADELRKAIFEVLMASNLARPGVLVSEGGAVFVDGANWDRIPRWLNPIDASYDETKQINWPEYRELQFRKTWAWLADVPNLRSGFARSDLGRALAAWSYLFGDSIDSEYPFGHGLWAILGLEAIYGEGTELITRQLVEKTNAFLGKQIDHKSALEEMYSFRSRFLHGDIDFPYSHRQFQGLGESDRFYDDSARPEWFAIRVLTATLQKMADEGRYELSFRTEVEPSPNRGAQLGA
jgi:hypothetical protein